MKKWNNPELLSLGVENTFEGDCDCTVGGVTFAGNANSSGNNNHPCHKNQTHNGQHNGKGHTVSIGCPDQTHDFCCCYGVSAS